MAGSVTSVNHGNNPRKTASTAGTIVHETTRCDNQGVILVYPTAPQPVNLSFLRYLLFAIEEGNANASHERRTTGADCSLVVQRGWSRGPASRPAPNRRCHNGWVPCLLYQPFSCKVVDLRDQNVSSRSEQRQSMLEKQARCLHHNTQPHTFMNNPG